MAYALILSTFLLLSCGIPPAGEVMDESAEPRMLERAKFMKAMEKEVEERFRTYETPGPGIISWLLQMATPLTWFNITLYLLWRILKHIVRRQDLALMLARFMYILQLVYVIRRLEVPLDWYMLILHIHCIIYEYVLCRIDLATQLHTEMWFMGIINWVMNFLDSHWYSIWMFLLNAGLSILLIAGTCNPLLLVAAVFQSINSQWFFTSLLYWSWVSTHSTHRDHR